MITSRKYMRIFWPLDETTFDSDDCFYMQVIKNPLYHKFVFKLDKEIDFKNKFIMEEMTAIKQLKEAGGTIDEIENNDIKFKRLENINFVLNKK